MSLVGQTKLGDVPKRVLNIFQDRKNRLVCTIEWQPRPLDDNVHLTEIERELVSEMGVPIAEEGIQPLNSFEDFQFIYSHYPFLLLDFYRTIIRPVRR